MNKLLFVLALLLAVTPVAAQKVYVDYDKSVDFDSYKTFAWLDSRDTSVMDSDPLMHTRIRNEIELRLSDSLERVASDPDLYVTYHTNEKEEMRLSTTHMGGYGYGGGWGWDPYWGGSGFGSSTTTTHNYTRGTLLVDIYDAREKKAIWRGSAEAIVPDNPKKGEKLIVKALDKMAKRFAKMYRGD